MRGYYEPTKTQVNVTLNGQVNVAQLSRLSDEELLKIIEQGAMDDPQNTPQLEG